MPKRQRASSSSAPVNRVRERHQQIAENVAETFARSLPGAAPTTTPAGTFKATDGQSAEAWPGPFATALDILNNSHTDEPDTEDQRIEETTPDIYASALESVSQYILSSSAGLLGPPLARAKIRSLVCLCINALVTNESALMKIEWNQLDEAHAQLINREVCAKALLTPKLAQNFARSSNGTLRFDDCSMLDENDMKLCLHNLLEFDGQGKLAISLHNCGRGFTDAAAELLIKNASGGGDLEVLEITGCYKLSDGCLAHLLVSCSHSLRVLNLSFCNVGIAQSLGKVSDMKNLQSLVLDNCTHLSDDDLMVLVKGKLAHAHCLRELSLVGLINITDAVVVVLLKQFGESLTMLNLSHCSKLTAKSIESIRYYCISLKTLMLQDIGVVDNTSWIGLFVANDTNRLHRIGPLQHVDIGYNTNISDEVVVAMCENYGPTLVSIGLKSCSSLSPRSLAAIALHATNLFRVDLSFVRCVGANVLSWMISKCSKLMEVCIWGNRRLCIETMEAANTGVMLLWNNMEIIQRGTLFFGRQ